MPAKRKCLRCDCPLICLKRDSGQYENRKVCVRCYRAPQRKRPPITPVRKRKAQIRAWKKANKEQVRQHAINWYYRNREAVNAKRKQLRIDNPEEVRRISREYYANREKKAKKAKNAQSAAD